MARGRLGGKRGSDHVSSLLCDEGDPCGASKPASASARYPHDPSESSPPHDTPMTTLTSPYRTSHHPGRQGPVEMLSWGVARGLMRRGGRVRRYAQGRDRPHRAAVERLPSAVGARIGRGTQPVPVSARGPRVSDRSSGLDARLGHGRMGHRRCPRGTVQGDGLVEVRTRKDRYIRSSGIAGEGSNAALWRRSVGRPTRAGIGLADRGRVPRSSRPRLSVGCSRVGPPTPPLEGEARRCRQVTRSSFDRALPRRTASYASRARLICRRFACGMTSTNTTTTAPVQIAKPKV